MIRSLKGIILEKKAPIVIIEVNNIGYEVYMPMIDFYKLPDLKKETTILTEFIFSQNTITLFGFYEKKELILFRELIKINHIGPKLALVILSQMSFSELIDVINNKKLNILLKIPGLGKKTANHLMIEMTDRIQKILKNNLLLENYNSEKTKLSNQSELAIEALIVLGYKPQAAREMIKKVYCITANDCESLIRAALRCSV